MSVRPGMSLQERIAERRRMMCGRHKWGSVRTELIQAAAVLLRVAREISQENS